MTRTNHKRHRLPVFLFSTCHLLSPCCSTPSASEGAVPTPDGYVQSHMYCTWYMITFLIQYMVKCPEMKMLYMLRSLQERSLFKENGISGSAGQYVKAVVVGRHDVPYLTTLPYPTLSYPALLDPTRPHPTIPYHTRP